MPGNECRRAERPQLATCFSTSSSMTVRNIRRAFPNTVRAMFKTALTRVKGVKVAARLIGGLCTLLLAQPAASESIQLVQSGGVYMVPVRINNTITIPFVLDSGAADISVPEDVFKTLIRTGTVAENDFIASQPYVNADGVTSLKRRFTLHELRVGDHVVKDVIASVAPDKADPLLGQSFLEKLPTWAMDNTRHVLVFGDKSPDVASPPSPALTVKEMHVGDCVNTTIETIGPAHRTGIFVNFANGGLGVSYDPVPPVSQSRVGDPVRMCLESIPQGCPIGDNRGRTYHVTNLRTNQSWTLPDASHECGGA